RMIALDLPLGSTRGWNELAAAGEFVEIFNDHIGIDDDIAVVQNQRRQFFQRVDLRIVVVGCSRRQRGRDEFDSVDQAKFDRRNTYLAGKWRGGGVCEFHGDVLGKDLNRKDLDRKFVVASETKQSLGNAAADWIASSLTLPCANASRLSQAMTIDPTPRRLAAAVRQVLRC